MTARDGFIRDMDPLALALDANRDERLVRAVLDAGDAPPDYQVANGPAPLSRLAGPSSTPGDGLSGPSGRSSGDG